MLVHALVAAVRTHPKPAVLAILNGLDKELADFVGCRLWVSVFAEDDLPKFLCCDR